MFSAKLFQQYWNVEDKDEVSDHIMQSHHQEWAVSRISETCRNSGITQRSGRELLQPASSLTFALLSGSSHLYVLLKSVTLFSLQSGSATPFSLKCGTGSCGQGWVEFHALCEPRSAHWTFVLFIIGPWLHGFFLSCIVRFCFVLQISDLPCFKFKFQ